MTASHVRRLTLHAADDAAVRAGAILVEDALRIATLPHERDPRLFVLRRFDIGAFRLAAGSHAISREIERRVAELTWTAVPVTSEQAGDAPAVWFADHVVAITELARRLAAGPPPVEWFWRHVARGASRAATPGQALQACLAAAAQTQPGAVAVALVVDAIERARADALLGELRPAEAARLVAVTFGTTFSLTAPTDGDAPAASLASAWTSRLATWAPRWRGDARAIWLAAIGAIATRGAIGSVDIELAEAQQRVTQVLRPPAASSVRARPARGSAGEGDGDAERAVADTADGRATETEQAVTAPASAAAPAATPAEAIVTATAAAPAGAVVTATAPALGAPPAPPRRTVSSVYGAQRDHAAAAPHVDHAPPPGVECGASEPYEPEAPAAAAIAAFADGEPTVVGGVLFLIRPLAMLGIAGWLDEHRWAADARFGLHLLAAIAAAYASPNDPLVRLVEPPLPDGPFAAPASWHALIGHRPLQLRPASRVRVLASGWLPLAAWTERRPPGVAAFVDRPVGRRVQRGAPLAPAPWALIAWRRAVERWSRRFAQLGCAEIVRRPGTVTVTPTHVDLRMALRDADVRVRLAGLDVDPGWVPWLGRVVTFHYT